MNIDFAERELFSYVIYLYIIISMRLNFQKIVLK